MFGLSKYLTIGMAVTIALMALIGYFYYNSTQSELKQLNRDIATSESNNSILKGKLSEQNNTILRIEQAREKDQEEVLRLSVLNSDFRAESEKLKSIFKKHDLGNLSLKKPGLIEKIINKGTKRVNKEFEDLTKQEIPK